MKLPVAMVAALLWAGVPALASEKIAAASGCVACHASAKKLVGPSYKEIAARYKGQADAPALLAERIRKGSKGVWGAAPMPPTPAARLSDADLKAVVAWVLKTP